MIMIKVGIIDSGMGNLGSVKRALEEVGASAFFIRKIDDFEQASHLVLPGVGSFDKAMENLNDLGLVNALKKTALEKKIPLLGICLGMQLLARKGFEGKETEGLNLVEGEVKKLEGCRINEPLPHIGWAELDLVKFSPLFQGIEAGKDFYFVHSYHFVPENESVVLTKTDYCLKGSGFVSAIQKDNIFGVQFHPEKSQKMGLQLLRNFLGRSMTNDP